MGSLQTLPESFFWGLLKLNDVGQAKACAFQTCLLSSLLQLWETCTLLPELDFHYVMWLSKKMEIVLHLVSPIGNICGLCTLSVQLLVDRFPHPERTSR